MDIEFLRDYCLAKQLVTEGTPFNEDTLVFKVAGKMFCLFSMSNFVSLNLKCEPELALEYREQYAAVAPGFHMSKTHWNTVTIDSDVNDKLLLEMVDHSYHLVISGLPKKTQLLFNS
jgi:predicted DNA-binding protein (MmcQ/YjbR family)